MQPPHISLDALKLGSTETKVRHPHVELNTHDGPDEAAHAEQPRVREDG